MSERDSSLWLHTMNALSSQTDPSLLTVFSFFKDIPPLAVRKIVNGAGAVRTAQEDVVFRQNEPAESFFSA